MPLETEAFLFAAVCVILLTLIGQSESMEEIKEYSNGEVTVVWKPGLCIHSANCAKGLPGVFQPREKPWVKPHQASTQEIVEQVKKCPSGALTTYINKDKTAI